jgi:hypothetical protein
MKNSNELEQKWREAAARVSACLSLPQDVELDNAYSDMAALEAELLTAAGDESLARLKLEIALNYAATAGVADDPAWSLVRSALGDLDRVGSPATKKAA